MDFAEVFFFFWHAPGTDCTAIMGKICILYTVAWTLLHVNITQYLSRLKESAPDSPIKNLLTVLYMAWAVHQSLFLLPLAQLWAILADT